MTVSVVSSFVNGCTIFAGTAVPEDGGRTCRSPTVFSMGVWEEYERIASAMGMVVDVLVRIPLESE